jgi:hypothetical protein
MCLTVMHCPSYAPKGLRNTVDTWKGLVLQIVSDQIIASLLVIVVHIYE